jgi:diguanylate cyclase (GGDEF)-like protein
VIHIPMRRDTHTASFSEIPLTLGLFLVTPLELVGVALVGTAVALWFHRGQRGVKFIFNITQVAAQAVIAVATFELLSSQRELGATSVVVAAIAAVVAADLTSAILVNSAIGLFRGQWPGLGTFELLGGAIGCVAKSALALLAVASIRDQSPAELALVCICGATMYLAFRVYARTHERYVRLEMLYRFRDTIAASVEVTEIARTVVVEACNILRAESAQLVVPLDSDSSTAWTASADGSVVIERSVNRMKAPSGGGVVTPTELASSIELHSDGCAWLSVRHRLGIGGSFDDVDARLFEALADQASVVLQNGQLVEQLELEVRERERAATHDSLTGLSNRASFTDLLTSTLADDKRRALFVVGLDDFSRVNETVGHDNGDRVLQEVSNRIAKAIDASAVARLGGDEFGILTSPIDKYDDVLAMHSSLAAAVGRSIEIDGLSLDLRASVGAALVPDHAQNGVALLRFADTAMRSAQARHSRFEMYSEAETDTRRRLVLAHDLRRAIEDKRLEAYFQPQLCLDSGRITGVEALARWSHQAFGFISPEEFVPIAEHTGLIDALTVHVLERALQHRQLWTSRSIELCTAVNVSARSLCDQRFPDLVARALLRHRCPAEGLTIEITESQLMAEPDRIAEVLAALHELGVRISIDDLGTGFSSLSSLRNLPIDEIKIDKSFVFGVTTNENDAEIVRSMAALGHSLGLHVVAEGVENADTVAFLASCGVDTVQGFYYSRPKPADEFEPWLLERSAQTCNGRVD